VSNKVITLEAKGSLLTKKKMNLMSIKNSYFLMKRCSNKEEKYGKIIIELGLINKPQK
jgi:hypothetical protein